MFLRLLHWRVRSHYLRHRPALLARFFETVSQSEQPEGLVWKSIEASDVPTVVPLGETLTFLQPVEVQFDAIIGGGMEDAPALASVRAAIAMLHWTAGQWTTGKCLFNVDVGDVEKRLREESAR